ncbi:hypothetical protein NDR87_17860 [Nocardia sp. CDC159]|uniref:Uncharacterized protein n=1 Tax=Nocardia pulmonis TaxID=2951408 RepID=A0A9X2J0C3_9NOCA|nr:hypothetical protein [Nocardia sp. CDC159]MCM6775796.1 hypothetical protein [Nocardia pulmonis]MCM6788228.1 hypothetical protein [Nocardia sp. CDC159]
MQGWVTGDPGKVEIPHLLLGFVEADTFLGVTLSDTGRGTFTLSGRPVTDSETLSGLDLAEDEGAIEVPVSERKFYGVAAAAR